MAHLPRRPSSILGLPLSPTIIHHLNPDPLLPTPSSLFALSGSTPACRPSDLRRSRAVNAAFSFVTPLPLEFPYSVEPATIEAHLAALEPSPSHCITPVTPSSDPAAVTPLGLTSPARSAHYAAAPPKLIHLSSHAAKQCLPNLAPGTEQSPERAELLSVLSGQVVPAFMAQESASLDPKDSPSEEDGNSLIRSKGFAPWSLCYAGHQFGHFAGQLGDGRAITILATPSTPAALEKAFNLSPVAHSPAAAQVELQLKGAGRTPFSRFADGLAVLRSSVREYLASEACHALPDFPTSRSLALVRLGGTIVQRERPEPGALVCRLAPSWLRVGSFEACSWRENWAGLAQLAAYAAHALFGIAAQPDGRAEPEALQLLREAVHRNARMVAAWQAWGFMHGVINTDNISLLGLTIDYGPFAFMDIFDRSHVCNHSDGLGRYSYANQPAMVKYALTKLAESLTELVGFQALATQSQPAQETFEEAMSKRRSELKEAGKSAVQKVVGEFDELFRVQYEALMRKRLGLLTSEAADFEELIRPLLDLMAGRLDYSLTLRALHALPYPHPADLEAFIGRLESQRAPSDGTSRVTDQRADEWKELLTKLAGRLGRELEPTGRTISAWRADVCRSNPRFVLRQWILEELIQSVEKDLGDGENEMLERVYRLARDPFLVGMDKSVEENRVVVDSDQSDNDQSDERLFGVGEVMYLGFQCSCSS